MTGENWKVLRTFGDEGFELDVSSKLHEFEGRAARELYGDGTMNGIDWAGLGDHYDLPKRARANKERIVVITNPDAILSGGKLSGEFVTFYDVANFKGPNCPFLYATIGGVTRTKDNQILVGVRGGDPTPERVMKYASGLFGIAPGGLVTFNEGSKNPIRETIGHEFPEEIGDFEFTYEGMAGAFEAYRPGPPGTKFVCMLSTDATLEQIQETNRRSNDLRARLERDGASMEEIALELKERNLPSDAWEFKTILGIQDNSQSIEDFVNAQPNSFGAATGSGPLMTYVARLDDL